MFLETLDDTYIPCDGLMISRKPTGEIVGEYVTGRSKQLKIAEYSTPSTFRTLIEKIVLRQEASLALITQEQIMQITGSAEPTEVTELNEADADIAE